MKGEKGMKTLQEIKDTLAEKQGVYEWEQLEIDEKVAFLDDIAKEYAQQFQPQWVKVSDMKGVPIYDDTIVRFDNGEIKRFEEDHPFAEITHFINLPEIILP